MNKVMLGWVLLAIGILGLILGLLFLFGSESSDTIKPNNSFKSWLPIVISLISFLVSAYTLWSTKLAPFDLNVVSTGRVVLTSNPSSPGARQAAMSLQLLFSNNGAKHGYVDDVALVLRKNDSESTPILLRSLFEHIEDTLNVTNQLPPPKLLAFTSFPVKPGDNIPKKIVFVPLDPSTELQFEEAKYSIIPYTLETNPKGEWKAWGSIEIDVTQEDIRMLNQTTATPTEGGGQFIKWIMQSKPTSQQEDSLKKLKEQLK